MNFDKTTAQILNTEKVEYIDVHYFIFSRPENPNILPIALDNNDNFIQYSNDNFIYYKHDYYNNQQDFIDEVNTIRCKMMTNKNDSIVIDEPCALFITSYSTGTGHGYAGLYSIIMKYLKLYPNKKIKIAIYEKSQKGILEIIHHFFRKDEIIVLKSNEIYKINKLTIIPYDYCNYPICFSERLDKEIISKYIIDKNFSKYNYEKVAIIKTENDIAISKGRDFNYEHVLKYCKYNNIHLINCKDFTEIELANIIFKAKYLILSWGTNFFKHYPYISDKCEIIDIFILNNSGYKWEYDQFYPSHLIKNYKNCRVRYFICSSDLNNIQEN
jgi:hypothetical protein